jgi:hypothetical protein
MDGRQRDYLDEHLPYMLKMLRYTHGQMLQQQHYLSWNAHFESFAVHARNLVNFLTNNDKKNFEAKDFVPSYRKARIGDLQGAMTKLREQVFHLAKRRPSTPVGKFDTENAKDVYEWIESNFVKFLGELGELRRFFNDEKADPAKDEALYITTTGSSGQARGRLNTLAPPASRWARAGRSSESRAATLPQPSSDAFHQHGALVGRQWLGRAHHEM